MTRSHTEESIAFDNERTNNKRIVKLFEVASSAKNAIVDGPFGSSLKTSDYVDNGIPVLQGKNITGNEFRFTEIRFITPQKSMELIRSKVVIGDILIVKIGSIGYAAEIDDLGGYPYAIIPANLAKISIDENKIEKKYLLQWLKTVWVKTYFEKIASKTAQPALSLGKIRELPVPLPPLAEQQRIAAQLDTADRILRLREQAIAKLDQLAQSVFLENLNESVMQKVLLSDLAHMYQPKTISSKQLQEDGKYIVYGANGVIGRYDEYNHSDSEVLVTCRGATCGTVNWSEPFAWITGNAMVVKPLKDDVTKKFLFYYFRFVADFTQVITGAAQPQITRESLSRLSVSIPIIEKQKALTDKVDSVYKCHALMSSTQMKLTSLMRTLSHQSFAVN